MALKSDKKAIYDSDMETNPTRSGAGDVTWTLNELWTKTRYSNPPNGTLPIYGLHSSPDLVRNMAAGVGIK